MIESYNAGSRNIDELFRELLALSQSLSDEEQRHVREQLTEAELTVFDLLTRVQGALAVGWRHKAQARAQVRLAIEDVLDEGLPRAFTPEIYQAKCSVLFEHVFETMSDTATLSRVI